MKKLPTINYSKMKRTSLISLQVSSGRYDDFMRQITELATQRISSYVCFANVHMLIEAWQNKEFAHQVNGATFVAPDGMPLVWGVHQLYGDRPDRMAGMDAMPSLLKIAAEKNLGVYFYGSTPDVLNKLEALCRSEYAGCRIAGSYSPPFRPLSLDEEEEVVQKINNSGAQLIFVSLGCPKQERWMANMQGRIRGVMLGVGGAFPVLTGDQDRAPAWMRRLSLEWAYRLAQEPNRLWKRYLTTNSLFLYLFAKRYVRVKVLRF